MKLTEKIDVLYIYGDTLHLGGIEAFMMNYFRNIDSEQVHIDFAIQGSKKGVFDNEILSKGSIIYYLPKVSKHPVEFYRKLREVLHTRDYRIIHSHCDAMNYRNLRIAQKAGVPVRISHCHNTQHLLPNKLRYHFYEYCRKRVGRYATECWACSEEAGKWLYGSRHYTVIPNAIDIEKFRFNAEKREKYREHFGIAENQIVLGHVGRFDEQKNHEFLLKVFRELCQTSDRYYLLLVGDGTLRKKIENLAVKYGIAERVIFTGFVKHPEKYYNAMDLFLLPSLFEGYGIVLEEAEVNGLFCIASNQIPRAAAVNDHVKFCDLNVKKWCNTIQDMAFERRFDAEQALKDRGYDIKDAAKQLEERYLQLYHECEDKKDV